MRLCYGHRPALSQSPAEDGLFFALNSRYPRRNHPSSRVRPIRPAWQLVLASPTCHFGLGSWRPVVAGAGMPRWCFLGEALGRECQHTPRVTPVMTCFAHSEWHLRQVPGCLLEFDGVSASMPQRIPRHQRMKVRVFLDISWHLSAYSILLRGLLDIIGQFWSQSFSSD